MDTPLPKISVIIPSFNTGKYLAVTLASVLKQNYPSLEVLVIDGGSTDETPQVVEAFGSFVTKFVSERDRGMLDAVGKGVNLATGDLCYWLNADDIAMPGAFHYVAEQFKADPSLEIVFGDDHAFTMDPPRLHVGATIRGLTFWDHFLFYRQRYSECVFWRREISQQAFPLDFTIRLYQDYGFFLPLAHNRKSKWVPKRLGAFRTHAMQNSQRMRELGAKEPDQIKKTMRERLGMSEEEFRARQAKARTSFFWRHVFYPKAHSGLRYLGRKLTGDFLRKRNARHFFEEWLTVPPEIAAKLPASVQPATTPATATAAGGPVGEQPQPVATVIIISKNRKDLLRSCLLTVMRQDVPLEVIVVDDASTDGTDEAIRAEFPSIRVERSPVSRGCVVQRNVAAEWATTPYIVSIDDDADFPSAHTVGQAIAAFDHPRVGAVAIPYINIRYNNDVHYKTPAGASGGAPWVIDAYRGTAYAVRRDLFLRFEGYRGQLFQQGEESDLCIRMLAAGYVTRLVETDPLVHYESPIRDFRRVYVQAAKNNVLFAWHNAPLRMLPVHVAGTTVQSLRFGLRHKHPFWMMKGLLKGYAAMWTERKHRRPVPYPIYRLFRRLRNPARLPDVEPLLPPLTT